THPLRRPHPRQHLTTHRYTEKKSRSRRAQQARSFGTTSRQLEQLANWLQGFGVTLVGMEATGIYWKPVFWVLERRFECWLLNAQHLHNVPGRKSDLIGSAWCCQ